MQQATTEHVDVLIVGAGISGIGAACRLTPNCPSSPEPDMKQYRPSAEFVAQ